MALKECKECGHEVSDKAYVCPACGVRMRMHLIVKIILWIILFNMTVVLLMCGVPFFIGAASKKNRSTTKASVKASMPAKEKSAQAANPINDGKQKVYAVVQQYIRDNYELYSDTQFPDVNIDTDKHVTFFTDDEYEVDSFYYFPYNGGTWQTNYKAKVIAAGEGEWEIAELEMLDTVKGPDGKANSDSDRRLFAQCCKRMNQIISESDAEYNAYMEAIDSKDLNKISDAVNRGYRAIKDNMEKMRALNVLTIENTEAQTKYKEAVNTLIEAQSIRLLTMNAMKAVLSKSNDAKHLTAEAQAKGPRYGNLLLNGTALQMDAAKLLGIGYEEYQKVCGN